MLSILAASFALLVSATEALPDVAVTQPRWQVNAAASSGTPPVLPDGLSFGAAVEGQRRLSTFPGFLSARIVWSRASAANDAWIIDHHQFVAALGVGVAARLGVGRVWAQAGAGTSGLYEVLSRHQRLRIEVAQVSGGVETTFSAGPYAFAELGVALLMRGHVSGFLAGGPTLARTVVTGDVLTRLGGAVRLGVAYGF